MLRALVYGSCSRSRSGREHLTLTQGLYLHAWWHVCAGFGTFFWVTYTAYFHYFALGDRPQLRGVANCVAMCYVVLDEGKAA